MSILWRYTFLYIVQCSHFGILRPITIYSILNNSIRKILADFSFLRRQKYSKKQNTFYLVLLIRKWIRLPSSPYHVLIPCAIPKACLVSYRNWDLPSTQGVPPYINWIVSTSCFYPVKNMKSIVSESAFWRTAYWVSPPWNIKNYSRNYIQSY